MWNLCKFGGVVAAGAAAVALMSPAAQAAPTKGDLILSLDCGGDVGNIEVAFTPSPDNETANEHAKNYWTPGFIVGTHDVFIPYDVDVTFTVGSDSFNFAQTKPAPLKGTETTCDISLSPEGGPEGLSVTGTVTGVIR